MCYSPYLRREKRYCSSPKDLTENQDFCLSLDLLYLSSVGAVLRSFGYGTDSPEQHGDVTLTVCSSLSGMEILPSEE